MKTYKEMTWDELEECAEQIRYELNNIDAFIELWESRDCVGLPSAADYQRSEELQNELGLISLCKSVLEAKQGGLNDIPY